MQYISILSRGMPVIIIKKKRLVKVPAFKSEFLEHILG